MKWHKLAPGTLMESTGRFLISPSVAERGTYVLLDADAGSDQIIVRYAHPTFAKQAAYRIIQQERNADDQDDQVDC